MLERSKVDRCVFERNSGGADAGVFNAVFGNTFSTLDITKSRFANNTAGFGAVRLQGFSGASGPLTISDTEFVDNAGGCVVAGAVAGSTDSPAGSLSISGSTFRRCGVAASASVATGSALRATLASFGQAFITNSLFEGNVATGESTSGGTVAIISVAGGSSRATITGSTFGGNAVGVADAAATSAVGAGDRSALACAHARTHAPRLTMFCPEQAGGTCTLAPAHARRFASALLRASISGVPSAPQRGAHCCPPRIQEARSS